jgi:hypothetical protein
MWRYIDGRTGFEKRLESIALALYRGQRKGGFAE